MIEFDFADFFSVFGPLELLGALLVGMQAGAFYAYHQRLGTRLYHTVVMSGMFFLTMAIVSGWDGYPGWERWISVWLLSSIFATGNVVGYRLRDVYERYRRKDR